MTSLRRTHRDPAPPVAAARVWRRIERRAVAGHDRQLLAALRLAVAARVPVLAARAIPARPGGPTVLGTAELTLPGRLLHLTGVTPLAQLDATQIAGPARLAGAGRYGPYWWVQLASDDRPDVVVLARRVRLTGPGGHPYPPAPGDPGTYSLEPASPAATLAPRILAAPIRATR
jgi:hypothetical protein